MAAAQSKPPMSMAEAQPTPLPTSVDEANASYPHQPPRYTPPGAGTINPGVVGQTPIPGHIHPYRSANAKMTPEFFDYDEFCAEWSDMDPYICHRKIGRGKYSEVFTATNRLNGRRCVIKLLKPIKEKRLNREIVILQNLVGVPNVINLYDLVYDNATGCAAFVFENVQNVDYRVLYPTFTDLDVRWYMYELLRTLDVVHAMGIFHRDVKPQNICIDHRQRKVRLIDWGLAEFYHPTSTYNVRVASRYYKGPELLVGCRVYDYSLDLWSLGCMFAAIIFRKDPFFHGQDNDDQLVQIVKVMGTPTLKAYLTRIGIPISNMPAAVQSGDWPRVPWDNFIRQSTPLASPEAVALLDRLLTMDHTERITARDAMAMPYFDPVRHMLPPPGSMKQSAPSE